MRSAVPLVMVKAAYDSVGGPETLLHVIAAAIDRERFPPLLALVARPHENLPSVLAEVAGQLPSERLAWRGLATAPLTARRLSALLAQRPHGTDSVKRASSNSCSFYSTSHPSRLCSLTS